MHGLGDHVGRYAPLLAHLASQRVEVHALDQLGHGRSGAHPRRGRYNVDSVAELVDDVSAFSASVLAQHASPPPLFLLGCSLGGLVAAYAALQAPQRYAGVVLAAPACDVEWTPVLHVMAAFGSVLALCLPNAALVPAVKTPLLSRNPAVLAAHDKDELVPHGDVKCRIANEALKAFRALKPRYAQFHSPLLIMHGDADKVTSPGASRRMFDAVGSRDKLYVSYPGAFHELFTEPDGVAQAARDKLTAWLLERAVKPVVGGGHDGSSKL